MKTHIELGLTPEEMAERNPVILRKVQIKSEYRWIDGRLKDLKEGDIFRFLAPSEPYIHEKEWIAKDKPYVNDYYTWTVEGMPVESPTITLEEG